ncbi:hypothetical protein N6B72_07405 [Chryseobacterium soli]|uniref:RHS repeat domain-containing protein n=1 Tax=Chryseobacterium soli TaxID=445961 RepID=UPI0029543BAD|nr:RHS repeat-associated core domain-containing protein [Chryseobacterium soli]MDV7696740.1 hypothetical protein [Chryseobacterium soli]
MQQYNITPPPNYGQNAGYNGNCVNNYAGDKEKEIYWFHPDHLGSSSYITGLDGEVTQNIEYFPSGETFVENHRNSNYSPYKFNGKELDAETGYYYYGARYYNPRVSLWLNVDPLADYNPFYNIEHYIDGQHNGGVYNSGNLNPYTYCYNSPVLFVDPNGKQGYFMTPGNTSTPQNVQFAKRFLSGAGRFFGDAWSGIKQQTKLSWDINTANRQGIEQGVNQMVGQSQAQARYILSGKLIKDIQTPEGMGYASAAIATFALAKRLGAIGKSGLNVEVFGGETSSLKGFINYDIVATEGIRDTTSNFSKYFKSGSVGNVVANNPQALFLEEISGSVAKGGTVTVRGTINNKYFKTIFNGKAKGLDNFEVVGRHEGLSSEGYYRSDGSPIGGSNNINEIILRKK